MVEEKTDRERALEKIKKLLTLAKDGRGNETEAETALRQAHSLMRKFNIDESEAILKDLNGTDALIMKWRKAGDAVVSSKRLTKVPDWVGVLGIGIGILCDCKFAFSWLHSPEGEDEGLVAIFAGYPTDVDIALWTFEYLHESTVRRSKAYTAAVRRAAAGERNALIPFGFTAVSVDEANDIIKSDMPKLTFRMNMAARLQMRMREMKEAEKKKDEGAGGEGRALVVRDTKLAKIEEKYGAAKQKPIRRKINRSAIAGDTEGQKTKIRHNILPESSHDAPALNRNDHEAG